MNETLSTILTTVVPSAITSALGYYYGKRKNNADASSSELDNVEKALAIYRGMVKDLSDKVKELEDQVARLENLITEYKQHKNN